VAMYSNKNFLNNVFDPEDDFPAVTPARLDLNAIRSHGPLRRGFGNGLTPGTTLMEIFT